MEVPESLAWLHFHGQKWDRKAHKAVKQHQGLTASQIPFLGPLIVLLKRNPNNEESSSNHPTSMMGNSTMAQSQIPEEKTEAQTTASWSFHRILIPRGKYPSFLAFQRPAALPFHEVHCTPWLSFMGYKEMEAGLEQTASFIQHKCAEPLPC